MKKLIAMMTVVLTAAFARADLVLYWNINEAMTENEQNYAVLYYATTAESANAHTGTAFTYAEKGTGTISTDLTKALSPNDPTSLWYYVALAGDDGTPTYWSDVASYTTLGSYITSGSEPLKGWDGGTFTAVPEPTSGMLLCLGAALLALRRKRA